MMFQTETNEAMDTIDVKFTREALDELIVRWNAAEILDEAGWLVSLEWREYERGRGELVMRVTTRTGGGG